MPRFYTTDGAIYDLSRDQAAELQNIWRERDGGTAAAFAAREFADLQMAPPVTHPNADPGALQRINEALARTAQRTGVTRDVIDEWNDNIADENRHPELQDEPDEHRPALTDLEQRITNRLVNNDMVFQTPLTYGGGRTTTWHQQHDEYLRQQMENKEMEKLKPLNYPLTPEVNPDGVKRLFKTRYSELESMYSDLHYKYNKNLASFDVQTKMFNDSRNKLQTAQLELQKVKANFVDGEIVSKRLHQICKEVGIPVPNERLNMQQQMDAFLGSVLSMIRIEGVDELAE